MSCENPKKGHFINDLAPVIPRSCPKQPNIHPDLRPKLPRCQLGFYIKSPLDPIQCCCLLRLTHFASYTSCSTYTQFNIKYSVNRKNTDKHDNLFAFSYTVHSYKVFMVVQYYRNPAFRLNNYNSWSIFELNISFKMVFIYKDFSQVFSKRSYIHNLKQKELILSRI